MISNLETKKQIFVATIIFFTVTHSVERVEKLNAIQNQELKADAVEDEVEEILASFEVDSVLKNVLSKSSEEEIQSEAILENLYIIESSEKVKELNNDKILPNGKKPLNWPVFHRNISSSAHQLESVPLRLADSSKGLREAW